MFRSIHPRLAGVGIVSVLCSFIITLYYTVMIGWGVVYYVASCMNPLPWSEKDDKNFGANCLKAQWSDMMEIVQRDNTVPDWSQAISCPADFDAATVGELANCASESPDIAIVGEWTGGPWAPKLVDNWVGSCPSSSYIEAKEAETGAGFDWTNEVDAETGNMWPWTCRVAMRRASEFFWVSVTRHYNPKTCEPYKNDEGSTLSLYAMFASAVVWICIFFAVFRGV